MAARTAGKEGVELDASERLGGDQAPVQCARLRIGNVPIDVVTFEEALAAIARLVESGEGGGIYTPNVDHVVLADKNEAFAAAYARARLSLADGAPLVWSSRLLGRPLPERVAGSDLVLPLMELAARRGWRVYLLGAAPGVADQAAEVLRRHCGLEIAGTSAPVLRLDDEALVGRIGDEVAAARPHLVLAAFGAPKQELLIDRLSARLRPAVLLGVGASLDFLAGTVKRAPPALRRLGLEWAFRLAQEPRRMWRRYLVEDPQFALILARTLLLADAPPPSASPPSGHGP